MGLDAQEIIVPGRGVVNLDAERINRAVQQYDERLRFGWNPTNKDWIIYIRMPRNFDSFYYIEGEPVYPVVGFQDRIPDEQEALERLYNADTRRHGMEIYDRMIRHNDKIRADREAEMKDLTAEVAERMEFEMRKGGLTEKYGKSTRPKKRG